MTNQKDLRYKIKLYLLDFKEEDGDCLVSSDCEKITDYIMKQFTDYKKELQKPFKAMFKE